ncbi:helix-turn-helix domain-containing protein [Burkholderia ubonensis]|uniref:helix-turn-helix domain-containing protein n=1 Tax=Burkholderia ubonensis TaxID=101571 RepID=UPI0009B36C99|nr:helix-turn-helix transcriptional regulator [Burkholderia ubonensis]
MYEIEEGSANVYADLGLPNSGEMLRKARLTADIDRIIRDSGWTQQEAAGALGITEPKLTKMLRGQFRRISLERLDSYRMKLIRSGVSRGSC